MPSYAFFLAIAYAAVVVLNSKIWHRIRQSLKMITVDTRMKRVNQQVSSVLLVQVMLA
jgi:hypothetical protein